MSVKLTDQEFDVKQAAVISITGLNLIVYNIPATEHDDLLPFQADWTPKYAAGGEIPAAATRSITDTEHKTQSRKDFEPELNKYVASWVKNNRFIPNGKKIDMKVHIDTNVRHVTEKPTGVPTQITKDLNTPSTITTTSVSNETPGKRALPDDVDYIMAFAYVFPAPTPGVPVPSYPTDDQFVYVADSKDNKVKIPFLPAQKGLRVVIRHGYKNSKGIGTLSETIDTFIP